MHRITPKPNITTKHRINLVGSPGDRVCLPHRPFCPPRSQPSIEPYPASPLDRAGLMSALGAPRVNHAFPSPPFLIREATLLSFTRQYRPRDDSSQQRGSTSNYSYNVTVVLCSLALGHIGGAISATWSLRFGLDLLFLSQPAASLRLQHLTRRSTPVVTRQSRGGSADHGLFP